MKKYLFVVAISGSQDYTADNVAFAHAFITAEDEDDAYHKGGRMYEEGTLINYVPEWVGINDYVIELPHRLEV